MSEARLGNGAGTQAHGLLGFNSIKILPLIQLKPKILPNVSMKGFETDITGTAQVDLKY